MLELEIVAVRCPECEQMVGVGENHACWSQELGMRAFEAAMWEKWKEVEKEQALELVPEPAWVWPCDICGNRQESNVNWEGIPANCERCSRYVCNDHGGVDVEGNIWCENCAKEHNIVLEPDPIPVLDRTYAEHIVPWSDAREGDKLNTEVGQDCSLCPPDSQYKIKEGYFVKGHPSCENCSDAEELSLKFAAGEIKPLGPTDIGKALVPSEQEILSLLEPTPYDAGVCKCGQHVEAGKLHEHQCSQLIEELGPEAEQAMRASEDERIESRTWEWEERRYEAERIAYCGWEEF